MGDRYYSSFELIRDYGTRVTDRQCSCCGQFLLYVIRYPDHPNAVFLCSLCDVESDKRAA
jgi:hypothetical protein